MTEYDPLAQLGLVRFTAKVSVSKLHLRITNEPQVMGAVAARVAPVVHRRIMGGGGYKAPLPRPKAGNPPLRRTGEMMASLGAAVIQRKARWLAIIAPTGTRGDELDQWKRIAGAAARTIERRDELRTTVKNIVLTTGIMPKWAIKRNGHDGIKVGHIKSNAITTNAAVAGVLEKPPQDKRSKAGNRGLYLAWRLTQLEKALVEKTVIATMRITL